MPLPLPPQALPGAAAALQALAAQVRRELALLAYPDGAWVRPAAPAQGLPVHDVLVVGGGQSGLGISAALRTQGLDNVAVLDRAAAGAEGVWERFARMPELRTPKALNGLDMGLPALSVQHWYAACFGEPAWQGLDRIPRTQWMDYLRWYRSVLDLKVHNGCEVQDVRCGPDDGHGQPLLAIDTVEDGGPRTRLARLVVLATGSDGAGAWRVPAFIAQALPADRCHHSSDEHLPFAALRGQRVAVLGHGASAFDNAVAALEAGAASVDLCFRRAALPRVNPHRHIETAGLMTHYPALSDATRWQVARHFRQVDQPPPRASFQRALSLPGFALHAGCPWQRVRWQKMGEEDGEVQIDTPHGRLQADHVICATGQQIDLAARAEWRSLAPAIARWRDRFSPPAGERDDALAALPYLGEHYECQPLRPEDEWVSRVFAFNAASFVSHGPHSTSISGHKHALPRLVRGLTRRLFLDQEAALLPGLRAYAEGDLPVADDFEAQHAAPQRFTPLQEAA